MIRELPETQDQRMKLMINFRKGDDFTTSLKRHLLYKNPPRHDERKRLGKPRLMTCVLWRQGYFAPCGLRCVEGMYPAATPPWTAKLCRAGKLGGRGRCLIGKGNY